MRKGKKLFILLLVAVLLGGGYSAAKFFRDRDDTDDSSDTQADAVAINAMKTDDVAGILYVCGDESIELVKDGDTWRLRSDPDFPVMQAYADTMAADAAQLTAQRLVSESSDDFAQYGLDAPETAFVFTLNDKTQVTYYIGNYNNFGGTYYMNVAGTQTVYLISGDFLDDFAYGLSDLADVDPMKTVSTDEVRDMTVTLDGKTTRAFYAKNGLPSVYSAAFTWFSDEKTPLNAESAHQLVGDAANFSEIGCADYRADDAELASFGLDAPVLTVKFDYTVSEQKDTGETDENDEPIMETVTHDETLTLYVGGSSKDGSLYAKTDASDVVYLIDAGYLQTLRDFDLASLRDVELCAVQKTEVQSIDVTIAGKTSEIVITRTEKDAGDESYGETSEYSLGGDKISSDRFSAFYSSVQNVKAESFTDKTVSMEDAPIVLTYHTNRKGFETVTLRLAPYDQNFYVAERNGEYGALINKRDAEKITKSFESILEK